MITVTVKRTTTVNGQSVTEEVTINYLPEDTNSEEKINQLKDQLHNKTTELQGAVERNKVQ